MQELKGWSVSGYVAFALSLVGIALGLWFLIQWMAVTAKVVGALLIGVSGFCFAGLYVIQPNQGKALMLFGKYVGTVVEPGLRWSNPLFMKKAISLRVRNFESHTLKVNDSHGNPIEIGAVVVWTVANTAEAIFQVDNYESFVNIQSEAAIRTMASEFPYDLHEDDQVSLRSHPQVVSEALAKEIQSRLDIAGVAVREARISHLAYAPEIASAMLQRQQASAIIAARQKIVEGAVGMVELALNKLGERGVVDLDEERKAAMVSNLLVILCGDKSAQPVVNSGSLY